MTSTTVQRSHAPSREQRPAFDFDQIAWPLFGLAASLAAALVLWAGRETTYTADDLVQLMISPSLGLDDLIAPYNGHFVLFPRLIFKGGLEIFGSDYLTFRVMTVGFSVLTCALVFVYLRRRVGPLVALAPTLVLLVLGSDYGHVLQGAFTLWLAISCGLGALIALERGGGRADLLACALLCIGIATYTVALAFLVAAVVAVVLGPDRRRRVWVVAIPLTLYAAWWLHASGEPASPQDQHVTYGNLLVLPAWAYQSLANTTGAVTGLDYTFGGEASTQAGAVLALAAVVALAWRLSRGSLPSHLWITASALVTLWGLGVIVANAFRLPNADRYLLPSLVAVLLVAGAAAAGFRWSRPALIGLYIVAAIGVGSNALQLSNGGNKLRRDVAVSVRSELGAVQVAGASADRDFELPPSETLVNVAFISVMRSGRSAVGAYLEVAKRYGPIGYSTSELRGLADSVRARVDALLIGLEQIALKPAAPPEAGCRNLGLGYGQASFELQPGDGVTLEAPRGAAEIAIRRFADPAATPLGTVKAGAAAELRAPSDQASDPWVVAVSGPAARACE